MASSNEIDRDGYALDSSWVCSAFMIEEKWLTEAADIERKNWSSADYKFTDTRPGGHFYINPLPQYTRYADTRTPGLRAESNPVTISGGQGNYGMGHYYSEAIDDNAQKIHLRMGVPEYTSLLSFFTKAFDPALNTLVNTGQKRSTWFTIVESVTSIIPIMAFPVLSATLIGGRVLNSFFTRPTSKFYTVKPTMHLYWLAVNQIVNSIAVNQGLFPRDWYPETVDEAKRNNESLNKETLDHLHQLMPDIFSKDYGIDVFAIANKAQRKANAKFLKDYDKLKNGSAQDMKSYIENVGNGKVENVSGKHNLMDFINANLMGSYWINDDETNSGTLNTDNIEGESFSNQKAISPKIDPDTGEPYENPPEKDSIVAYFDAEFRQGSQFACFRVDHTGSSSETFTNSVGESGLQSSINSTASGIREFKFGLAGGNLIGGNMIGDAIQAVGGFIADTASAAMSGVTLGLSNVVHSLIAGSSYDIPQVYKDSSVSLPESSYTMTLISPYNNPISKLQNIYIPLAMLMAAALPRSTGKQTYGSPFLVQLFDRGRNQVLNGMITSLSITRGTSNQPFSKYGEPLAIEVSFSVTDLSSIMHIPIGGGTIFGHNVSMDEDNLLYNYLATLVGQDIYSQLYTAPKAKINLAKRMRNLQTYTSPGYLAQKMHTETTTGFLGTVLTLGTGRALDSLVAGPDSLR